MHATPDTQLKLSLELEARLRNLLAFVSIRDTMQRGNENSPDHEKVAVNCEQLCSDTTSPLRMGHGNDRHCCLVEESRVHPGIFTGRFADEIVGGEFAAGYAYDPFHKPE